MSRLNAAILLQIAALAGTTRIGGLAVVPTITSSSMGEVINALALAWEYGWEGDAPRFPDVEDLWKVTPVAKGAIYVEAPAEVKKDEKK